MKKCPTCQSQYTDDTLIYCLQDGARLDDVPIIRSPTFGSGEEATVIAKRPDPTDQKKSRSAWSPILIGGAVIFVLGLIGIAGVGVWLYFRGGGSGNQNIGNAPVNQGSVSPSPKGSNTSGSPAPTLANDVKLDISQRVMSWKGLAEARSLDAYMDYYADTVNYYTHPNVGRDFVRKDKERAFSSFDSITINISNMDVTVEQDGRTATALFDKEWVFMGGHRTEGKVRSQVTFQKVGDKWLITGERDQKVYYTK